MQSQSPHEARLAQHSDEDDFEKESQFQFAIVGDKNCLENKDRILEFLHQKDLLSSVDISDVYNKNAQTFLLVIEDDVDEAQLNAINTALSAHKEFSIGSYHMVNWAAYNRGGSDDEDDL